MFSAARPAFDGATRRVNGPSTSWLRSSLSAIARACSIAIRSSVASRVTRPSPFLRRNAEIWSAGAVSSATAAWAVIASRTAAIAERKPRDIKRSIGMLIHHLDRIHINRRLLVRVRRADRLQHGLQPVLGADRLDAILLHHLQPADRTDAGIGARERA